MIYSTITTQGKLPAFHSLMWKMDLFTRKFKRISAFARRIIQLISILITMT